MSVHTFKVNIIATTNSNHILMLEGFSVMKCFKEFLLKHIKAGPCDTERFPCNIIT